MIRARYQRLTEREKRTFVFGAVTAGLLLGYLLVWRPLSLDNKHLREQLEQQRELAGWMRAAAQEVEQLRQVAGSPPAASGSLQQQVARQASQEGLQVQRMQSSGDTQTALWLDDTPFNQVLRLVDRLSAEGVQLEKANLRAAQQAGKVDANLVFTR